MDGAKKEDSGINLAISDITRALQLIHDSHTDNETRQKASEFLDSQKHSNEAAQNGYLLAEDVTQQALVRHFGLSLLEHSVRHRWHSFTNSQVSNIHSWTITLSQGISDHDPLYLRNKIAHLVVEVAKKDWAISWFDMDSSLMNLWKQGLRYKELVLTVLENISEDVFSRDDPAAGLRGQDLHNAVVEIFTPASAFSGGQNKANRYLRADGDGWLTRICDFLASAYQAGSDEKDVKACVCKALATLRSTFTWVMGAAIISTNCLETIFMCLASNDTDVLLAAVEALHSLYGRTHLDELEFATLVTPMYQDRYISHLQKLYEWSVVDCRDVDPTRYSFSKKFSETIAFIAGHVEEQTASSLSAVDLSNFFRFMVGVIQHKSLVVSIPVLHAWVKILKSQHTRNLESVWAVIGPLLDTASQRILRYELLPEDSEEPSIVFLNEDIDTIPERHAFLGNYRRFCFQIIETVAQRKPNEAISHILSQVDVALDHVTAETPRFDPTTYTKSSASLLRLDAHLTVVEAALKGYSKWVLSHGKEPHNYEQERSLLESNIESWASSLLTRRRYEDPLMKQRIIKLAVECSARALERNQAFALKVLEHILLTQTVDQPQYPAYSEAVRELQVYGTTELRRLAFRHADYFASFYDQLEAKIREVLSTSTYDEKAEAEMYGTLLIVLQRAENVHPETRDAQLNALIESMLKGWQAGKSDASSSGFQDSPLDQSLSSFENFCKFLGVGRIGAYLQSKRAEQMTDWSSIDLDVYGLSIQSEMNSFVSQVPLRMTKTALGVMTEHLEADSQAYNIAVSIWSSRIKMLLPKVLRLVEYSHSLHDVELWPDLPPEMRSTIERVLQDRFWQAGISSGSRDQFYTRVTNTKSSLEGFASFVRGKIRLIREACYQILHSMSRLGNQFYSYSELPGPLAESLIASATRLSSHQFSVLLQMIRSMVDDCPIVHREHFLPPILSILFSQIDHKITSEWEKIDRRKSDNTEEDNLTAEMKEESILRQLTYTSVNLVAVLLDPLRGQQSIESQQHKHRSPQPSQQNTASTSLRTFILTNPTILEPLLLFCTHTLTVPDSRSASTTTRVLRTIIPTFAALSPASPDTPTAAAIREYISTFILKAAITALNDGYFADLQRELASLIATIWVAYGCLTHFSALHGPSDPETGAPGPVIKPAYDREPLSNTPREIILSLPGMTPQRVDAVVAALTATGGVAGQVRQQRALVLDLLDGLRGVRISELGKIGSLRGEGVSRLQEKYMRGLVGGEEGRQGSLQAQDQEGMEGLEGRRGVDIEDGPDLGGVGDLLG